MKAIDKAIMARAQALSSSEAEAERIAGVLARGVVPRDCGPEVAQAPARGVFRLARPKALYPKGEDGFELKDAGYCGRATIVSCDVFDRMLAQAARRRKDAPLRADQVAMARHYRALVERHASAGVRCSSLEASGGGGSGGQGSFIDAVLRDRERIVALRRRIGSGSALVVRRVRPSKRGSRVGISDRKLVDMVCLEDMTLDQVAKAHGWAVKGAVRSALLSALSGALDRMLGPVRERRGDTVHFGEMPGSIWGGEKNPVDS